MEFSIETREREEIIDISEKVENAVKKLLEEEKKIVCNRKGNACLIFTPHTTCSIIINEISNKDICEDILDFLRKQIPQGKWRHNCQEKNGDSHIKASILGSSQIIPIEQGKLQLGTWQKIGLAEFDGPRERRIVLKII
jgi:secondary thiamine-phosphate synthase enzyme